MGRARSICHEFHSREPREAWPLKDRERYGTGDKDEKSVNGTQISIGKFPPGKRNYLLRNSEIFPVERTKKSCFIYIPTGISGNFWQMENAQCLAVYDILIQVAQYPIIVKTETECSLYPPFFWRRFRSAASRPQLTEPLEQVVILDKR